MPKMLSSMPTPTATKSTAPASNGASKIRVANKTKAPPKLGERKIVFPTIEVKLLYEGSPDGPPISFDQMREILGWETELEYAERMVKEHPGTDPAGCKYG